MTSTPTTDTPTPEGIGRVVEIRTRLAELTSRTRSVAAGLDNQASAEALDKLREKIDNDDFVILIAGEFNTGKSTTINAMLGDRVLPAYAVPTTAVLSVLRWGEQPHARLFRIDGDARTGLAADPVDIAVADLELHVTVDEANPDKANSWGLAEISWPLPLLRNGVLVVDSPGLNEDAQRSRVTHGYLARADAVVFILDATRALAASEREFLNLHVRALGHEDTFFVCNKINQVLDPEEQDKVRQRVRRLLGTQWHAGDDRVFFVNSHAGLYGRRSGDHAAVAASGIPQFEQQLTHFLGSQRAKLKVVPPARHLQGITSQLRESIHRQLIMLDRDVEELRVAYERAQEPLRQLEQQRQLIIRLVEQHLSAATDDVRVQARQRLREAADLCPQWATEIDRQHRISSRPWHVKQQVEAAAKEVSERLDARMQEHFAHWQQNELVSLLTERAEALDRDIDDNLRRFSDQVDALKLSFAPQARVETDPGEQPSGLERVLSTAIGWVISPGAAVIGGRFGFREMLRSALPQIALGVGLLMVGAGPLALLAILLGSGLAINLLKTKKADQKLTELIAAKVAEKIRETAAEQADALAAEVATQLAVVRTAVDESLGARLREVRDEAYRALQERDKGEQHTAATKLQLRMHLETLKVVEDDVIEIITDFATRP